MIAPRRLTVLALERADRDAAAMQAVVMRLCIDAHCSNAGTAETR